MGRNIAAGVAGILVAVGLVWMVEMVGHSVYPPPPNLDFSDTEAIRAYLSNVPLTAFLFIGGAWFIAALGGTFAACKIGRAKPLIFSMVVGGFVLIATMANLVMIPHPLWFSLTGIAGVVVGAWLGMVLAGKTSGESAE